MLVLVVYRNRIPYPPGHPAPLPLYTPPSLARGKYNNMEYEFIPYPPGGARRLHAGGPGGGTGYRGNALDTPLDTLYPPLPYGHYHSLRAPSVLPSLGVHLYP
jgi:hypothetical protein